MNGRLVDKKDFDSHGLTPWTNAGETVSNLTTSPRMLVIVINLLRIHYCFALVLFLHLVGSTLSLACRTSRGQ